ncbi:periplasmic heavy metal sensor [Sphingomonas koreensis]
MRRNLIVALIAFAAALLGVFAGRALAPAKQEARVDIHAVLHDRLDLDADQASKLDVLERGFAVRRRALEATMRAHNRRLAEAIREEHRNGPAVEAAIDAIHVTMGQLQKETLAHVFAMRALLREDQARIFDEAVTKALVEEQQ